ncbi:MAG: tetratricopeptide repeat protein [Eubacteriales bacterium]|nr:tetratricopeptide repeat protein [Eubacteriales bacterium]
MENGEAGKRMVENKILSKEDYEEPVCLLKMGSGGEHIPVARVFSRLDEYLNKKDYEAAERHLRYWLSEADGCGDLKGELSVLNEQIGLYRKIGKQEECFKASEAALILADSLEMDNTETYGTTLINAATGYNAFGKTEKAVELYRKAKLVYENILKPDDSKLAGLYNNMALAEMKNENYRNAEALFMKAVSIMEQQPHGEAETAITYLNLADLASAEFGSEAAEDRIISCLEKAEKLLDTEDLPRDGYYAFVCEKCAPVFGYYGFFLTEKKLTERAEKIYERA